MRYPHHDRESLTIVLWNKLVLFVRDHSLKALGEYLLLAYIALLYSVAMIDAQLAASFARWHGDLPAKLVIPFALIFNWRRVARLLATWCAPIFEEEEADQVEGFEGIPMAEWLHYLFTPNSFGRSALEETFGLPRDRADIILKKLDDLRVFVRGEKNARLLNPDFSRQDIASIFAGKSTAEELTPLFKKGNMLTSRGSGPAIREEVDSLLSPAPSFKHSPLADLA